MRTLLSKAFLFIILSILFINAKFAHSQNLKVGYVDSEVILKQLPEAKKIQTDLEGLQKLYLDTISVKESELKMKAENFKTRYEDAQKKVESGQITSQADLKALNDEMTALQSELQNLNEALEVYKQRVQNELLQKQAELFKPVKEKITRAIEDIARNEKISFVFDKADGTMLYGDTKFDLTFKVLDKLK